MNPFVKEIVQNCINDFLFVNPHLRGSVRDYTILAVLIGHLHVLYHSSNDGRTGIALVHPLTIPIPHARQNIMEKIKKFKYKVKTYCYSKFLS